MGESQINRYSTSFFFLQAVGVSSCECLDQRGLPVIDVACGADDDGFHFDSQYMRGNSETPDSAPGFPRFDDYTDFARTRTKPAKEKRGCETAYTLRQDERQNVGWAYSGERITERPGHCDCGIGKRSGCREPVRRGDITSHCKRDQTRAGARTSPNDAEQSECGNGFAQDHCRPAADTMGNRNGRHCEHRMRQHCPADTSEKLGRGVHASVRPG